MEDIDNAMEKLTQKSSSKETPDISPRRLRDREKLKKRKLEMQVKEPSQVESKKKRGRRGKSHSKKAESEPEIVQQLEDEAEDRPLIISESERPECAEESIKLSVIEEAPTTSADLTKEIKSPNTEFLENLKFQLEDLPEENMPLEEKHPVYL
ncbi:uncharacterized protein LOC103178056 isoform X2 [Callorhinchus milii]|uniref:uncharacterized protein LOC103178056 isoform X2 n=1 Tax=Callorhinchus milii TaxID=7868 RepID=UPI0004575047|nr:uncharacterized protein LOC103178056 isoform X2 [Callorhinchus milii]|eukprot:gi/632950465/ref/XP_007890740.1/ PREDICTED: UPF0329 protein ECU02_1540-like isoform X2 [Callorhinchus milii]